MIHAKDIHGNAWTPCQACPHATPGECPSRAHRPLCDHLKAFPDAWRPIIAGKPPEKRAAVPRKCAVVVVKPPRKPTPAPAWLGDRGRTGPARTPARPKSERDALRLLAIGCDYRGPVASCGCVHAVLCLRGNGRRTLNVDGALSTFGDVTIHDCESCMSTPCPAPPGGPEPT
jgi:hypothetical protein